MNKKSDQILFLLKEDLKFFLSICFGVFLFVLFFQPFPLDQFDFNNRLLIVAGLAAIVLLFMILVRAVYLLIVHNTREDTNETAFPSYLGGFIIITLSSVAFAFYLRYVGSVSISFFIMSKVIAICLAPALALGIYDEVKELRQQNELLLIEKEIIQKQVQKYQDVALIKSADNYVEIVYKEGEHLKKKLLRNTMRNIEQQIKSYSNFIRCHRICIVNTYYIEKLNRKYNNHWLTIKEYQEQIPVSRQYLLKLKDAI